MSSNFSTSIHSTGSIKSLNGNDFNLDSKELISLKSEDCITILFHTDNEESKNLFTIWLDVASKGSGTVMGECNIIINTNIGDAFMKIKENCNHPFFWARLNQYPFILTYRGGWPQSFYNGNRDSQDILNYILMLACESCYMEKDQKFKGIDPGKILETSSANPTSPTPKTSTDFKGQNYRGYNESTGVVEKGSEEEKEKYEKIIQNPNTSIPSNL